MPSPLTTHALDTSTGQPAAGLMLRLYRVGEEDKLLVTAICDANGRVSDLIDSSQWEPGTYRIRFETKMYFDAIRKDTFYPFCDVTFIVTDTDSHYHVPLLISPFGFTTYRGS